MTDEDRGRYRMMIGWYQHNAIAAMRDALAARTPNERAAAVRLIDFWRKRERACLAVLNESEEWK